jgi:hypothetical protein
MTTSAIPYRLVSTIVANAIDRFLRLENDGDAIRLYSGYTGMSMSDSKRIVNLISIYGPSIRVGVLDGTDTIPHDLYVSDAVVPSDTKKSTFDAELHEATMKELRDVIARLRQQGSQVTVQVNLSYSL